MEFSNPKLYFVIHNLTHLMTAKQQEPTTGMTADDQGSSFTKSGLQVCRDDVNSLMLAISLLRARHLSNADEYGAHFR